MGFSENRDDSAVVGLGDVVLHSVGLQSLDERGGLGAVLVRLADSDDVGVGLRGVAGSVLNGESIGNLQTGRVIRPSWASRSRARVSLLSSAGIRMVAPSATSSREETPLPKRPNGS